MLHGDRIVNLVLVLVLVMVINAGAFAKDNVTDTTVLQVQKKAEKLYGHIHYSNKYQKAMKSAANRAYQLYNEKQMQRMITTYKQNIFTSKQFQAAIKKYVPPNVYAQYFTKAGKLKNMSLAVQNDRLFICISSSMPMAELRSYVKQVAYLGVKDIVFVMRGFIGGVKYMTPTIRFFYNMAKVDPNCKGLDCKIYNVMLEVDPLVFRKYHIDRVPAFVFVPNFQKIMPYNIDKDDGSYKLYGDVSLKYAIQVLYKNSKYVRLKELLEEYKKKSFYN